MCKIFSLAPSCRSQLPLFQILQIGARFKMPCQAQFKSTWPICRCVPSQSQLGVIFYECKTPWGSSGFGSFDCTIRLRKGGGRGELLPRCGHSSSHCSPDLGRGGEDLGGGGHMCKLSTSPPSHCELTLITADRQARPLWLDTHCKLATHYAAYPFTPMNTPRTRNKSKDKERDKDKNKDNDGLFILRHKLSKEREGPSGKLWKLQEAKKEEDYYRANQLKVFVLRMSGQHEAKKWVLRQWDQKKRKLGLISTRRRRKTVKTEEGGKDGEQERLPVRTAGTSVSHKSTPIVIVGAKVFFSSYLCIWIYIFVHLSSFVCIQMPGRQNRPWVTKPRPLSLWEPEMFCIYFWCICIWF